MQRSLHRCSRVTNSPRNGYCCIDKIETRPKQLFSEISFSRRLISSLRFCDMSNRRWDFLRCFSGRIGTPNYCGVAVWHLIVVPVHLFNSCQCSWNLFFHYRLPPAISHGGVITVCTPTHARIQTGRMDTLMPPIATQVRQHSCEPFDRNLSHHYSMHLAPQVFPRVMYPFTRRAANVSVIAADSAPPNKVGEAISTAWSQKPNFRYINKIRTCSRRK